MAVSTSAITFSKSQSEKLIIIVTLKVNYYSLQI